VPEAEIRWSTVIIESGDWGRRGDKTAGWDAADAKGD
jgi:hypothetical protein